MQISKGGLNINIKGHLWFLISRVTFIIGVETFTLNFTVMTVRFPGFKN